MTAPLLSVRNLSIRFGGLRAVDDVSFEVGERTIHGLIGPNGSGKTTTLNMLSGFYRPTSGSISLGGEEFTRDAPHLIARRGIVRTFQMAALQEDRTLLENVLLGVHCGGGSFLKHLVLSAPDQEDEARAMEALSVVGLTGLRRELVRNTSIGIRHKTEIARALAAKPRILLLDEPSTGLNSAEASELQRILLDLKASGITILIVEHNMRLIMSVCDRITVLDSGVKIADGSPSQIRQDPRVIESYLGRQAA